MKQLGPFSLIVGGTQYLKGSAGVPMITWPLFEDQFSNEKLVTQILGIGVAVGAQKSEDGEMARSAVEEGGSSFTDLTALIEELRSFGS
ncbi:hypothetical protein M0R45_007727 [Rubus argutus]|uniref:Uncharacterized protein n=1 Tax=Rubus argutus TaxID=59490 RepID=A0AAW1XZJ6_RUBAR